MRAVVVDTNWTSQLVRVYFIDYGNEKGSFFLFSI
jgi:hypothetical protein